MTCPGRAPQAAPFAFGGGEAASVPAPASAPTPALVAALAPAPAAGLPAPAAAAVDGETKKQLEALNDEFLQWVEEEWEKGEACDWSSAVRESPRAARSEALPADSARAPSPSLR